MKVSSLELKAVLSNILNNSADAYGSRGGKIVVALNSDSKFSVISIVDKGAGIPAEYVPKLGVQNVSFKGERGSGRGLGRLDLDRF